MSQPIVNVQNLHLTLGNKKVINDLSFTVKQGEIFAFLGANGSGKTSTIRALLGIYKTDTGLLHINGQTYTPAMAHLIGYLPEDRGLYSRGRVLDTMIYFGELKGMTTANARNAAQQYLNLAGIADKATTKLQRLSGGQQQKVQLGVALINKPKLLILDEPTKGLDPVNRKLLMDMVLELQKQGSAVIYITHLMEEVERLAERLLIIKDGRSKAYGSVSDVKSAFGKATIQLHFTGTLPKQPKTFTIQKQTAQQATLLPIKKDTYQPVIKELAAQPNLVINQYNIAQPSIEDVFINLYQEKPA